MQNHKEIQSENQERLLQFVQDIDFYLDSKGAVYIPSRRLSLYNEGLEFQDVEQLMGIFKNKVNKICPNTIMEYDLLLDTTEIWSSEVSGVKINVNASKFAKVKNILSKNDKISANNILKIKTVKLDKLDYQLVLNKGEKVLSFSATKASDQSKTFKVLSYLYKNRTEFKGKKLVQSNEEFLSLEQIARECGLNSAGAAYQHIKRLRVKFKKENLPIEIEPSKNKYRLVIHTH
jgi:biotin operon repressor